MESAAQIQQQPQYSEEQKKMAMQHQKLDQERKTIMQKLIEIGEEKREHQLVLETLSAVEDDKKCWRLINGVLVEKTKKELVPDLETNIENMESLWKQLDERSSTIRQEMVKIEEELGHSIKNNQSEASADNVDAKGTGGVLV